MSGTCTRVPSHGYQQYPWGVEVAAFVLRFLNSRLLPLSWCANAARDLPGDGAIAKLEEFHKRVASILEDPSILEHFKASLREHSAA
jgi:hypothetical protein